MNNYQFLKAIYDYRDTSKYVYNADLVEFTEFGAQLKDRVPANVGLGATFEQSSDANYSNGIFDLHGSIFGTVNCQNNKLALLGGFYNKSIDYFISDDKSFADKIANGQVTFQFWPNYSNNPSSPQNIFHIGEHAHHPKNHLEIIHTTGSDIVVNFFTDNNNLIQIEKDSVVFEEAVQPHEFRIAWKSTDDNNEPEIKVAVYFEGQLIALQSFNVETFDISKIRNLGFGQNIPDIKEFPNFYISDLLIENIVPEFPENYEVRKYLPMVETRFTTSAQKVKPVMDLTIERLDDIKVVTNEDSNLSDQSYVKFTFEIDGVEYFFDRTDLIWKEHKDPEDISDLGYMLLYKDQLILRKGQKFRAIPYLRTIKGDNTPAIYYMEVIYDEFVPCQENYPTALVYGYVKDVTGEPIVGARILITPSRSSVTEIGNFILPKLTKQIKTGLNGYWDAQLTLSNNFDNEILYNFQIIVRDEIVYEVANIKISKEGTIKFEDLINENESVD